MEQNNPHYGLAVQNHVYDYNQSNLDQESNLKIENIYEQNEGSVVNNEEMRYVDQRDN